MKQELCSYCNNQKYLGGYDADFRYIELRCTHCLPSSGSYSSTEKAVIALNAAITALEQLIEKEKNENIQN